MSRHDRKTREKEAKQNRILDAAEEVIFTQGIEHATMDEIAEQAQLSKGTLYYYFQNKHDLYFAVNNRGLTLLTQNFVQVFSGNYTGLEMVRHLGNAYINFVKEHPHYFSAMMDFEVFELVEDDAVSPMLEQCEQKGHELFAYTVRALQIGMQDGTIDDRYGPHLLATQIWGSIRGITQLFHINQKGHYANSMNGVEMEIDELFSDFLDIVIRGIQNLEHSALE